MTNIRQDLNWTSPLMDFNITLTFDFLKKYFVLHFFTLIYMYIFASMNQSYTIGGYINCATTTIDKIKAINLLIDAMLISITEQIGGIGATVMEYSLDDGQTKVKTVYRSISEIRNGINDLETLKQMYINKLSGRVVVIRDEKTFRR